MRYFYIHGFNSGPQSRSGTALEHLLGEPIIRCHNDYSQPFLACMANLKDFILAKAAGDAVCVLGTSLGGFYALQLRLACIVKVCAWNPVIFPALQAARFVGENTRFTDGVTWNFTRATLLSYAGAPDPRVWRNSFWKEADASTPERKVFFGVKDDLLDHEVGLAFWKNHAQVELIDSGHHIEDFNPALPFISGLGRNLAKEK